MWLETSSPAQPAAGGPCHRSARATAHLGLGSALWEGKAQALQQQLDHAVRAQGAEADDLAGGSDADGDHGSGVGIKRHGLCAWLPPA